eukprot:CAMPEP_0114239316 /NCGR_PEP_ID=MMETSP0058-20121206/8394_1 /TAXON_ID=36894 /ORGANISM="Pyramimonas parkeae, CCMP726" /LENGTH=882 /DNA_ID=CAMNT_0001351487 /DNA_START=50 /DNA_END=2698 /DNA_ORIENTATION=-
MAEDLKTGETEPMRSGMFDNVGNLLNQTLSNGFYKVGMFVGTRPLASLCTALLITISCGMGLIELVRVGEETRDDKLWVPDNSQAQDDKKFVEKYYGNEFRVAVFTSNTNKDTEEATGSKNILQPTVFDELYTTWKVMQNVSVEYNGTTLFLNDVCYKRNGMCSDLSILQLFNYNPANWSSTEKILAVVNQDTLYTKSNDKFDIDFILGGITRDEQTDHIKAAEAVSSIWPLEYNEEKQDSGEYGDRRVETFEKAWLDAAEKHDKEKTESILTYNWFAARSFGDEFGGAIGADLGLLNIAIILNLVYANVQLTQWNRGCRGTRVHVVMCGILAVGMAVICCYGLCAGLGVIFSPLMNILPFLLLGIGVDDMFVIVNCLDATPDHAPVHQRVASALSHAGPSITLTSLTDFFAFMIGSNTSLPALRAFCIYAGVGVVFCFILQVFFFTAVATFDMKSKLSDGCCSKTCSCCAADAPIGKTCCGCNVRDNYMTSFLEKYLANPMRSFNVKLAILGFFAVLGAVGLYGSIKIKTQADINDFIPEGSYVRDFLAAQDKYFDSVGDQVYIFITEDFEYEKSENWPKLTSLFDAFTDASSINGDTTFFWFVDFSEKYNVSAGYNESNFYADLDEFLVKDGGNFKGDIKFVNGRTDKIASSRMVGNHNKVTRSDDHVKNMDNLRSVVSKSELKNDAIAYTGQYLQYEQYKVIGMEAARNLGLCMMAICIVVFLLIVNPVASSLVVFSVGLVVMNVVGYMYFWGLNIDNVTIIMLVLALGLSVDYSAHLGHAFMHKQGTNDDRMVAAMGDMGVAVFNGAMSTFMAVIVLGGSKSYVFITFFKQLFLCTVFGCMHGLVMLPALLSLFGPPAYQFTEEQFDDGDKHATPAQP